MTVDSLIHGSCYLMWRISKPFTFDLKYRKLTAIRKREDAKLAAMWAEEAKQEAKWQQS